MAPTVDTHRIQPQFIVFETVEKTIPVTRIFRRPQHFGNGAFAWEDHVFGMAQIGDKFRPEIALPAENVRLQGWFERLWDRLKFVDLL